MSWRDVFSADDMDLQKSSRQVRDGLSKLASQVGATGARDTGFWCGWGAAVQRVMDRGGEHALLQLPMSKKACADDEFGVGELSAYALLEAAGRDPEFRGWLSFVKSAHDVMAVQSALGSAAAVVVNGAPGSVPSQNRVGYEDAAVALMGRNGDLVEMIREDLVNVAVKFSRK